MSLKLLPVSLYDFVVTLIVSIVTVSIINCQNRLSFFPSTAATTALLASNQVECKKNDKIIFKKSCIDHVKAAVINVGFNVGSNSTAHN